MQNEYVSNDTARAPACHDTNVAPAGSGGCPNLNHDGSVTLPSMEAETDWVLSVAAECEKSVATMARQVACLRAARGGKSNACQIAGIRMTHARLKSVSLSNDRRSILARLADEQEELRPLLVAVISKILEIDLLQADLLRCDEAMERKRAEDELQQVSGIWPEARGVVTLLSGLGIREGHWSTLTRATAEKIASMIRADNDAAAVGSPDDPQTAWPRSRKAR